MKKYLSYLPYSVTAIVLSILGYLNFVITNILLLLSFDAITTIMKGQINFPNKEEISYLAEYTDGYAFGILLYLIEFIVFLIIFKFELTKILSKKTTTNILKSIFIYTGILLFIIEFLVLIFIESHYIFNLIRTL